MTTPTSAHRRALENAAKAIYEIEYDARKDEDFPRGAAIAQAEAAINAYLASLPSSGYKVMPREPTEEMWAQHKLAAELRISHWHAMWLAFSWPPKEE